MDISDDLLALFSATIEEGNPAKIRVPDNEVDIGELEIGRTYRIAVLPRVNDQSPARTQRGRTRGAPDPPVEVGDQREVEIEDIGEQGDGITRVERGFVVIVPDTEKGERLTVEITDVGDNVAFAEVIDRHDHFD